MEESRRLLSSANQALARVEQIGRGEAGRVELGVIGTAMWGKMRPVMRRFLKENPNVEVLFRENMPAMQMAMLERRELDAGVWRMATAPSLDLPACACTNPLFWWPCRKSIRLPRVRRSRLRRCVTNILSPCLQYIPTGRFCSACARAPDSHR